MCRNNGIHMSEREPELRKRAEQLFLRMGGFSKKNQPTQYQWEDIDIVWQFVAERLQIDIFVKPILEYSFCEDYMLLESQQIFYDLPLLEYEEQITGVYAFLVSEQTIVEEEQSALEQLYTHLWQNAYLDAAREWLQEWIGKNHTSFVSQSIAPGFYGIPVKDMRKIYDIMGGQQTGVKLRENEMLSPEKSVLGIYLTLTDDINIFGRQCAHCLARGKNCEFCMEKL